MEIVFVTTSDLLRLHGCYLPSSVTNRVSMSKGSVDGAVLVHGIGGNFYSSKLLFHFAQTFNQLGISVVIINTRGHDMINLSTWQGRAQSVGAAFESVDHCRFDLAAWVEFLVQKGHDRVLLFGHSLGAIKSLYAAAHQPPSQVQAVIGLSPTRLSYSRMLQTPSGQRFRDTYNHCCELVAEGRGENPILVHYPVTTWMSPMAYVDKYGPEEKYNWLRFIDKIEVPTRVLFGAKELQQDAAFEGLADDLSGLSNRWRHIGFDVVGQADHFYTSQFQAVDDLLTRWLIND